MAVQQVIRFGEDRRKKSREKDTYYQVVGMTPFVNPERALP